MFPGPYYVIKGLYFVFTQYCVVSVFITLHILLLPLRFTAPALYWKIDAYLFKTSLGVVSSWFYTEGVTLKESGDSLKDISNDEVLLLCNHQSTADIGVVMQSMYSKGPTAGHMIWIMDRVFRLTHFGWMSCFHDGRKKKRTDAEYERAYYKRILRWHEEMGCAVSGGWISVQHASIKPKVRK